MLRRLTILTLAIAFAFTLLNAAGFLEHSDVSISQDTSQSVASKWDR